MQMCLTRNYIKEHVHKQLLKIQVWHSKSQQRCCHDYAPYCHKQGSQPPTCKDDGACFGDAAVLKSFEPQGISNQTKKDWHHDEPPQPPHIRFNLQRNHSQSVSSAQKWTCAKLKACVSWHGDGLRCSLSLLEYGTCELEHNLAFRSCS